MFRSFLKSDSLANIHRIDEAREVSAVDVTPHKPQDADPGGDDCILGGGGRSK